MSFSKSAPQRRQTLAVRVGDVVVGGDAPVVVQSMTNTDTADYLATAIQIAELARAGSELVRITVNTPEAAAAVPRIREHLAKMGHEVPLIGDFTTTAIACWRISRNAPRRWPSTASTPVMSVTARSAMNSSPR